MVDNLIGTHDEESEMCPNGTQNENDEMTTIGCQTETQTEMCPNGTQNENDDQTRTNGSQILPTSERQTRYLTKLEPDQQREAWQKAVEEAGGKVPSGRIVKSIVDKISSPPRSPAL